MPVDSDSAIAWHRAQLKKLRETLKSIETARFTVGEPAQSSRTGKTQKAVAELEQKIRQSQHIIAAYERQTPAAARNGPAQPRQRELEYLECPDRAWPRQFAISAEWPEGDGFPALPRRGFELANLHACAVETCAKFAADRAQQPDGP
jgi:hypothetical protein